MALPQPRTHEPAPARESSADSAYHFDAAHGDVAALHAQIEKVFAQSNFPPLPSSPLAERLESAVQIVSRASGPTLLLGAIAGIAYVLI